MESGQGRPDRNRRIKLKYFKKVLAFSERVWYHTVANEISKQNPGLAKFGIALEWGSRGRWFESSNSDQ